MHRVDQLDLASAVRALRRRADLSQRELAQRAGVPSTTVSRIESGEISNPRVRTLEKLAEAAGSKLTIARATAVEHPAASTALEPVPHDHLTDAIGRRYPAHLDVRTTFPYFGQDWTLLDAGTYTLNRDVRDDIRARKAPAATVRIARAELVPGPELVLDRTEPRRKPCRPAHGADLANARPLPVATRRCRRLWPGHQANVAVHRRRTETAGRPPGRNRPPSDQ